MTTITCWFINTSEPARVLAAQPRADRGFGRKYLSQLNPTWPVTPIGLFPLNRSEPASAGEFYVGGYPGITVVQTWIERLDTLSDLDTHLLQSAPAKEIVVFARDPKRGFGGFARFTNGQARRSLCAVGDWLFENLGMPEPFEGSFWAGEHERPQGSLALPFYPAHIVSAAERAWLGVEISPDGPDLEVAGFAIDGRPEPKVFERPLPAVGDVSENAATKLGIGLSRSEYDDYAAPGEDPPANLSWKHNTGVAFRCLEQGLRRGVSTASRLLDEAAEKIRYSDRDSRARRSSPGRAKDQED